MTMHEQMALCGAIACNTYLYWVGVSKALADFWRFK